MHQQASWRDSPRIDALLKQGQCHVFVDAEGTWTDCLPDEDTSCSHDCPCPAHLQGERPHGHCWSVSQHTRSLSFTHLAPLSSLQAVPHRTMA